MKRIFFIVAMSLTFMFAGMFGVNAATSSKCFIFDSSSKTITGFKDYTKISSGKYCYDVEKLDIPSSIDGVPVERIGEEAFTEEYFTSVVIPNSVKVIGNKAFLSNDLKSATIPSSVTSIGYAAFNDNPMNKLITDPSDPTKVVSVAYDSDEQSDDCGTSSGCGYVKIDVPSNIKTIGTKAFYGMRVSEVNLSDSVEVLESKALVGARIEGLNLSKNLKSADLTLDYTDFAEKYDGTVISHYWCANEHVSNVATICPYTFSNYNDSKDYLTEHYNVVSNDNEAYVYQVKYNKFRIEFEAQNYVFDKVEIYKYNYKTKKYYLYTTTTNTGSKALTKGINLGERHKFKFRLVYENVPYISGGKLAYKTIYSDYSTADSDVAVLDYPENVKIKRAGSKKVKLSWKKVDGATKYRIYKLDKKAKKYKSIGVTKKTTYTTSKKNKKGKKSWYKIKAYRTVNGKNIYSDFSERVGIKVK